jgi:DNA-binding IscR family transcriptional regulator
MITSNKMDYAFHVMDYIAAEKGQNGCTMNEIYRGESIPREYAEAMMTELTQRGYLLNEDKVNGRFKLARPWNEATLDEIDKLMNNLWCWPLIMDKNRKKRGPHKNRQQ